MSQALKFLPVNCGHWDKEMLKFEDSCRQLLAELGALRCILVHFEFPSFHTLSTIFQSSVALIYASM